MNKYTQLPIPSGQTVGLNSAHTAADMLRICIFIFYFNQKHETTRNMKTYLRMKEHVLNMGDINRVFIDLRHHSITNLRHHSIPIYATIVYQSSVHNLTVEEKCNMFIHTISLLYYFGCCIWFLLYSSFAFVFHTCCVLAKTKTSEWHINLFLHHRN